jgi:acetyltransferase-like isoleucine patch superfamily enzyme
MSETTAFEPGRWTGGSLPSNVRLGPGTLVTGDRWTDAHVFRKFRSERDPALVVGVASLMNGVLFNLGKAARVSIGDHCTLEEVFLICEQEVVIGNRVIMGWRATVVDSDFHPLDPVERMADAVACSPLAGGRPRMPFTNRPVTIEDDVWVGPNAAILKGVRVGAGAFIEPGSVVVKDVPPRARVLGNPAQVIGQV